MGSSIRRSSYSKLSYNLAIYESIRPNTNSGPQKHGRDEDDMFYSALAFSKTGSEKELDSTSCKSRQHKCSIFLAQNYICKFLILLSLSTIFRCNDLNLFAGPSANPIWVNGSLYMLSVTSFVAFKTLYVIGCRFSSLHDDLRARQPTVLIWNEKLITISKVSY